MTMIYTGTTISFMFNGKFEQVHNTHPKFTSVVDACKLGDFETAASLVNIKDIVTKALAGTSAELRDDNVYFQGQVVRSTLAHRIVTLAREGFDASPLLLFLENLMSNPSKRAVDELYGFLEVSGLPITDDGHFLAYKSVQENFTDHFTGSMDNSVGQIVSMERNQVDEDKDRTCSYGLHFAAHEYASNFGRGKMVVLKINPKDVVAIPSDYNNQKGRCCSYEVIEEVERSDSTLVGSAFVDTGVTERPEVEPEVTNELNIGDRVRLTPQGIANWGNSEYQGGGGLGTLIPELRGMGLGFVYRVLWDNEGTNTYEEGDLELAKVPEVNEEISEGSRVRLTSQGIDNWGNDEAQGDVGGVGTVRRLYTVGGFTHSVDWDNGERNSYHKGDLELAEVTLSTYVPQESNYDDCILWGSQWGNDSKEFWGEASQFPVNRDVPYSIQRNSPTVKEYRGDFYFSSYDEKHDNLVFVRNDREGNAERYITMSDVDEWDIIVGLSN